MSQEGANLPQEVEGSTATHGNIPVGVGSPAATVMPASSNSRSVSKPAGAINNAGLSERASPAVLSAACDNNAASSKIAGPVVLLTGEENKAEFKLATSTVLLAGEGKDNDGVGPKLVHDCDNDKSRSHAGVDTSTARSKLTSPAVLHADDGNMGGSKITSPVVPHATVDKATGSKIDNPTVLHASEHNNADFKLKNPAMLHASKDKENNMGRPKFASPLLPHAGAETKARNKLIIQAVSHATRDAELSRLTRSAAALYAAKHNISKLAIPEVPRPYTGKGNNAGSSKATKLAAANSGGSNTKDGKNNVAREQRAREANMGGGRGKGNISVAEDTDHDVHIFTERERRKKMKNMFSTLHGLIPHLPEKADKATIVGEAVNYVKVLEGTLEKMQRMKLERKRALAVQQQQLALGAAAGSSSSSRASSARHPAPAPASREANLADMVHGLEAQQAAAAAGNKALQAAAAAAVAAAAASAGAGAAGGSSSSSAAATAPAPAQPPRGTAPPFPAPTAGFQTWSGQNVVVSVANNEAYINLHIPRQQGSLTKAIFVLTRHHIEAVTTTVSGEEEFRMYGIHARLNPVPASARFLENLSAEDRFKLAVSEMLQLINTNN